LCFKNKNKKKIEHNAIDEINIFIYNRKILKVKQDRERERIREIKLIEC